jgi:hypothetical protein
MRESFSSSVTYFSAEGRENLDECLELSFAAAIRLGLDKVVIFTHVGDGVRRAFDAYVSQAEYAHIHLVGVTFPQGKQFTREGQVISHDLPLSDRLWFADKHIPLVRAHLPFDPIAPQHRHHGVLAQDLSLIGNALSIFCGSMSLCVQAVLMACDAGEVGLGEHVIVLTSDTALVVRAAPTARLLTDLIVREVLCKPIFLTIGKAEELERVEDIPIIEGEKVEDSPSGDKPKRLGS